MGIVSLSLCWGRWWMGTVRLSVERDVWSGGGVGGGWGL